MTNIIAIPAICATAIAVQGGQPVLPPVDDWATVFICRFDEAPLRLEGNCVKAMHVENTGIDNVAESLVNGPYAKALNCANAPATLVRLQMVDHPVDQFSVEFWLKPNASASKTGETIYEFRGMHRLRLDRDKGELVWELRIDGAWESLAGPAGIDEWHHFAGTFDGKVARFFLDNVLVAEKAHAGRVLRLNTYHGPIALGSDRERAGRFNGLMDEFRLSRVARTSFFDNKPIPAPVPTAKAEMKKAPPKETRPDRPYHLHSTLRIPAMKQTPVIDGKMDDACWADVPLERFLETGIGFDWGRNWATYQSAIFRIGYDKDNLYLACRILEQTPGGIVPDNADFWKTNCIELYLQPDGYGKPYLQVAANPYGKNWSAKWILPQDKFSSPHARDQKDLPLPGLRQAAVINGDTWTIELAIPFKDLGLESPVAGSVWRGNVAYSGKDPAQNISWGYVWPLFYWHNMFPRIEFGDERNTVRKGDHLLRGSLVDEQGNPVVWGAGKLGALDLDGRPVLTNSMGEFTIPDLPAGKLTFRTLLPQYDRLDVTVDVRLPVEVIPPIVMSASGIYASGLPPDSSVGKTSLFEASAELPPDLPVKADTLKPLAGLNFLATAGEFESRAFCVLANTEVDNPRLALDPSFKLGGQTALRIDRAEPRWTERVLVREEDNVSPEESSYMWRFMRLENPEKLQPGDLRHVVLTMKLPGDAAAGTYTSALRLFSGETELAAIPVTLTVPSFRLVEPKKQVGFYHWQRLKGYSSGAVMSDDAMRRDYRSMRELGATQLVAADQYINPNAADPWAELRRGIRLQKEAGFGPYYITFIPHAWAAWLTSVKEKERTRFKQLIDGLDKVEDDLGLPRNSIVITFGDEIQRHEKHALNWVKWAQSFKNISSRKNYMTTVLKDEGKAGELFNSIMSVLDISCFNGTPDNWEKHRAVLKKTGAIGWYYPNSISNTLYARIANGYYLWGSPFSTSMPWCFYCSPTGEFFNSLENEAPVFCYMIPHPEKPADMIPALLGDAYREGYDDLRYLATLEYAINQAAAAKGETAEVNNARALLAEYTGKSQLPRTYSYPVDTLTPEDLLLRRAAIVKCVEALNK
jgi:hypothetical protein